MNRNFVYFLAERYMPHLRKGYFAVLLQGVWIMKTLDHLSDIQKMMLCEKNALYLDGVMDFAMLEYVKVALMCLYTKDYPPLTVYFTGPGGNLMTGYEISDLLRLYKGETTGIVLGYGHSMVVNTLQVLKNRFCAENATIQVHNMQSCLQGLTLNDWRDTKFMRQKKKDIEKAQLHIYRLYCKRTRRPLDEIKQMFFEEKVMSAREAVKAGLIDKIV